MKLFRKLFKKKLSLKMVTLEEYLSMTTDKRRPYDLLIKSCKPVKVVRVKFGRVFMPVKPKADGDLWQMSYSDIIEMKDAIWGNLHEEISELKLVNEMVRIVYGIEKDELHKISAIHYFNCTTWIVEEMTKIIEIEQQELSYEPDPVEKNAGIDQLDRFGHMPTIDMLAEGNISRYGEVLAWKYAQVFQKLCYNKTLNDINKKITESYVSK